MSEILVICGCEGRAPYESSPSTVAADADDEAKMETEEEEVQPRRQSDVDSSKIIGEIGKC